MGLCKCPHRKVTNQFCFEHRVNVCEHCMVKKHPRCVVQSYLQWLQDSDYDPNCPLCHQDLGEEPCVRLVCYHLFHWVCLDRHMRALPADTAPAGYACPSCQECIFPADKLVSPVADALRDLLKDVNWARAGLGMPLLEDRVEKRPSFQSVPTGPRPPPEGQSGGAAIVDGGLTGSKQQEDSVIQFSESAAGAPHSRSSSYYNNNGSNSSKSAPLPTSPLLLACDAGGGGGTDADEDKYRRRSPLRFLARWWRTTVSHGIIGRSSRRRMSKGQRLLMWILTAVFAVISLIVILSYFSMGSSSDDPMLDPMNNPNIHVDASV